MFFKNLIILCFVSATLSFAQSSDSTAKNVTLQSPSVAVAIKTGAKTLRKQQKINKPNTTWSKIKDLFLGVYR